MKQLRVKGDMPVTKVINKIIRTYPDDMIRDIKMKDDTVSFLRITKDDKVIRESVQLITEP